MINTLTSDSAADELPHHSDQPWVDFNFDKPGLHLTDQGLEMTSAWSFPVGATLSVGISCPTPSADQPPGLPLDEPLVDLELLDQGDDAESETALVPAATAAPRAGKAAVHATGIVISCVPSQEGEGGYQLTIYFLDHLANLILREQEKQHGFLDEPSAAGYLTPQPQKLAPGKTVLGPADALFGMSAMPYFMGA
jgi:hypothetical protein